METLRPFGVLQVYKSIKGISGRDCCAAPMLTARQNESRERFAHGGLYQQIAALDAGGASPHRCIAAQQNGG